MHTASHPRRRRRWRPPTVRRATCAPRAWPPRPPPRCTPSLASVRIRPRRVGAHSTRRCYTYDICEIRTSRALHLSAACPPACPPAYLPACCLPTLLPGCPTPGASTACLARAGARGRARPRTARAGGLRPRVALQQAQSTPARSMQPARPRTRKSSSEVGRGATGRFRSPLACSGQPSGPERRSALLAPSPRSSRVGAA